MSVAIGETRRITDRNFSPDHSVDSDVDADRFQVPHCKISEKKEIQNDLTKRSDLFSASVGSIVSSNPQSLSVNTGIIACLLGIVNVPCAGRRRSVLFCGPPQNPRASRRLAAQQSISASWTYCPRFATPGAGYY
jgi:hypothetical protein